MVCVYSKSPPLFFFSIYCSCFLYLLRKTCISTRLAMCISSKHVFLIWSHVFTWKSAFADDPCRCLCPQRIKQNKQIYWQIIAILCFIFVTFTLKTVSSCRKKRIFSRTNVHIYICIYTLLSIKIRTMLSLLSFIFSNYIIYLYNLIFPW